MHAHPSAIGFGVVHGILRLLTVCCPPSFHPTFSANCKNSKYSGDQIANNFAVLSDLTKELWPLPSTRPLLIGPDPHSFKQDGPNPTTLKWIAEVVDAHMPVQSKPAAEPPSQHADPAPFSTVFHCLQFLAGAKQRGVNISGVSHHEYIEADAASFLSAEKLDVSAAIGRAVNATVAASPFPHAHIVAGEAGRWPVTSDQWLLVSG